MQQASENERVEILSANELRRTIARLASQVLEQISDPSNLLLIGIPTRGVNLAEVLAKELQKITGLQIEQGILDPTFHRDDLRKVGTRMVEPTNLPCPIEGKEVVLVDDVIFTGRTVRAALEALQTWGRPKRVQLLVMIDRGHREFPIQPDFCGREVPTRRTESIQLRLLDVDGEEGIFLQKTLI